MSMKAGGAQLYRLLNNINLMIIRLRVISTLVGAHVLGPGIYSATVHTPKKAQPCKRLFSLSGHANQQSGLAA